MYSYTVCWFQDGVIKHHIAHCRLGAIYKAYHLAMYNKGASTIMLYTFWQDGEFTLPTLKFKHQFKCPAVQY